MFKSNAYFLDQEGDHVITPHFKVKEFRCYDGTNVVIICEDLVKLLESIRVELGVPLIVNSGYRTPAHNLKVKGASHSYHMLGAAADVRCSKGVNALATVAEQYLSGWGGIGIYSSFVHIDIRPKKYRWNG